MLTFAFITIPTLFEYYLGCHPYIFLTFLTGASLSEPQINVLNASGVCRYVCMCISIRTSYRKFRIR